MTEMNNHNMKKRKAFIFLFIAAGCLAVSALVMCLWNWLLPEILHVQAINYWQAMGLFLLSRILFGSFRFGGPPGRGFGGPGWKQKWMNMSDEEKAAMKARWKEKCGPRQP